MNVKQICPVCKKELLYTTKTCPHCDTTVFDEQKDGTRIFLDPAKLDCSKKYKVHGFADGRRKHGYTEFYPGDLVELPAEPDTQMTDISVTVYIDGGRFNRKFIMPMRDIAITSSSTGMMMNAPVRYIGPYGERLRSPEYTPENILRDDEPDPIPQHNPMGFMGMSMMNGMHMMNEMQAVPTTVTKVEPWTCQCGSKNTGRFCAECGLPVPNK